MTPRRGTSFGTMGTGTGQFTFPAGIDVDPGGSIFVTDDYSPLERVQKFDATGAVVATWGSPGMAPGQFGNPVGIAVDGSGNAYVADRYNSRVERFGCP